MSKDAFCSADLPERSTLCTGSPTVPPHQVAVERRCSYGSWQRHASYAHCSCMRDELFLPT